MANIARRPVAFALAFALLCGTLLTPHTMLAAAPPTLSLPIPPGETWKVIQGYNCGTHTNYDDNAFDLVNADGRSYGAPVLAAADGTVWWAGGANNAIILSHGNGYYTMYSHLSKRVAFAKGQSIARGAVIGFVGNTGGGPVSGHLHFQMFYGEGISASNRVGVPLKFVEGYDFPDSERCNQYMDARITATGTPAPPADTTPPSAPTLVNPGQGSNQIVQWSAATDDQSGVKGYQVYVGPDPNGVGEWFVPETQVALPTLDSGRYWVRVRSLDNAGNASAWVTLFDVTFN